MPGPALPHSLLTARGEADSERPCVLELPLLPLTDTCIYRRITLRDEPR
jgi:hypothetical protein